MSYKDALRQVDECVYVIEKDTFEGQKVPVILYLSDSLFERLEEDAIKQAVNASTLPGVQKAIYIMPDVHVGYGFPVGGVMATASENGVISPGSVGYDINCGVRLIATAVDRKVIDDHMKSIMNEILNKIPAGVGSRSSIRLTKDQFEELIYKGAKWAVDMGFGTEEDINHIENFGVLNLADASAVSEFAYQRGSAELGTVGSGNHFVEIQTVEEIYDENIANKLGIWKDQILIMVHSGSRGFGHQICVDYLKIAKDSLNKYGIELPDLQLACMPFSSKEGQDYFKAMCAGANYAFANRQILGFKTADILRKYLKLSWEEFGYKLIYDHAHNIAKLEKHEVDNVKRDVVVHRKGATRAFPPYHPEIPPAYREIGQPVIIPGDMGRASFLLMGQSDSMDKSFGTACHGAGRLMSRKKAKEFVREHGLDKVIKDMVVVARGKGTIMEEIPQAYKDVTEVVRVVEEVGIAKAIAKLKPLGTLKG